MKHILLTLAVASTAVFATAQTSCNELFISEYCEGSGNNKGMEIYNPTNAAINLSNYRIVRYSNGSTVGSDSLALSGTINPNDVWVVVNGQTVSQPNSPACDSAMQGLADQLGGAYPDPMYMNGDDAICLIRISPYAIIDIFGKQGEDPGVSWTDVFPYTDAQGAWWTANHTLQRKATVTNGVMTNPTAFNPTLEYDSLPTNTWTGLGAHSCICATGVQESESTDKVSVYPNPSQGNFIVNATQNISRIEVYNILGDVIVVETGLSKPTADIDLTDMPGGLYIVQVTLSDGTLLTSKITKS